MLAQLSVVHQLTGDYRSGFTAICDATIALLIYAVKWAFISKSVGDNFNFSNIIKYKSNKLPLSKCL